MWRRTQELPLADHGLIGDGRTAALVARDGAIDWLCQGRFDGPAVFCRLLDREAGGFFQVAPAGGFGSTWRYVGRTNVLETEFVSEGGRAKLTDFMPLDEPGGPMVVRRLEGVGGEVAMALELAPTFDFARCEARLQLQPGGCAAQGGGRQLRLACAVPLELVGGRVRASFSVRAGQTRWFVLTEGAPPLGAADAERCLRATLGSWERWSAAGTYPAAYEPTLRRSALVAKLLIHAPTGAIVAAPTASLPEDPGGERNWDYRFSWLRDSSWLVSALMELGYHEESMAFLGWLESLELGSGWPSVVYDLDGRRPLKETRLAHLRGHLGSRPVRIGNAAAAQRQHDVLGEVVAAVHSCRRGMPSMRPLRRGLWELVSGLANLAAAHGAEPDSGLWEVRDRRRHFVSSKMFCWAALDRALALAELDQLPAPRAAWLEARARLRDAILTQGYDERRGAFRRAFDDSELDAAVLLLPRHGLLPYRHPRLLSTVERVRERLCAGGLVRRYTGDDGVQGGEGAFVACSFWLVECLARQGRGEEARRVFEGVLSHANDLGLLSEEIGVRSGGLLGNYPQALTHLALIRAGVALAAAEASGGER